MSGMDMEKFDADGEGDLGKKDLAIALSGLFERMFAASVIAPALSQVGMTIGDQAKYYRIKNLVRLNEHLKKTLEERGLGADDLGGISLAEGLPLLEKASYQDDDYLQKKWAGLIASLMEKDDEKQESFSLGVTYVEILNQLSRLDCEVLGIYRREWSIGENKRQRQLSPNTVEYCETFGLFSKYPCAYIS